MRPIRIAFLVSLLGLSLLWLLAAAPQLAQAQTLAAWRGQLLQASGLLALGAMGLALVLTLRLPALERLLDGLDKMIRLHRWLGVAALGFSALHGALVQAPHWAVQSGWPTRWSRSPRAPSPTPGKNGCRASAARPRPWASGASMPCCCWAAWRCCAAFPTAGSCRRTVS